MSNTQEKTNATQQQRLKISKQIATIEQKAKKLYKQIEAEKEKRFKLIHELHKLTLVDALNNGVKVQTRFKGRSPKLDKLEGVLLAVRRTQCTVDFGDAGRWDFPINGICTVDDVTGLVI